MGKVIITDDIGCHGATPAHDYCTMDDMAAILDDIARDLIPTNTGTPFPVVWPSDFVDENHRTGTEDDVLFEQVKRNQPINRGNNGYGPVGIY